MRNGLIPSLVFAILIATDLVAMDGRYSLSVIKGAQSFGNALTQEVAQFYVRTLRQVRG
ncbi:MAG: hypothetical protein ACK4VM_10660 [Bosea sp. (in: a-proteobacteria)]